MADPESPSKIKRNVALLALCQAVFNTSTGVVLSVSALVGLALASNKSLATLPQALQWEASAAFAIPVAFIMRRFGRKAGRHRRSPQEYRFATLAEIQHDREG